MTLDQESRFKRGKSNERRSSRSRGCTTISNISTVNTDSSPMPQIDGCASNIVSNNVEPDRKKPTMNTGSLEVEPIPNSGGGQ